MRPGSTAPSAVIASQRPRRIDGVAAEQRAAVERRVVAEPGREGFEPARGPVAGQGETRRKPIGSAPLAARSERLTRNALRAMASGVVGEKMHAPDQRVGGEDEIPARGRPQQRDVILQAEPGRAGERREIARDEFVFAGAGGHGLESSRQGACREGRARDAPSRRRVKDGASVAVSNSGRRAGRAPRCSGNEFLAWRGRVWSAATAPAPAPTTKPTGPATIAPPSPPIAAAPRHPGVARAGAGA